MFRLGKKNAQEVITVQAPDIPAESIEKAMGLKEYISVDDVKAHLVDILEENRKMRTDLEQQENYSRDERARLRKEKEVALIEADEWKKRARESDQKIKELEKSLDKKDQEIAQLSREKNDLIVAAEMEKKRKEKKEADSDATSTTSGT